MTKHDLYTIIDIIDNLKIEERKLTEAHMALNPTDKERERIASSMIAAYNNVWLAIRETFKNSVKGGE